ncbi:MAG TPA: long-chain fatty acid--CoA ligase [Spirochaetota bacterium]|nr:long-chain fatty acid--CoA ligase [Spirochaetota bacterium]HPJ38729.1 long-chain fatty acid--CoA ligase [Spirochaetota bacterium]HPQ52145.1 long-chain fatty acid--CoA ligase [Spirochaetota bacterium]
MERFPENSIGTLLQNQVERRGDNACVAYKKNGAYVDISWREMDAMIRSLGLYLISIGVAKGDRVALFSENRYEWWVADQAILSIGAVNVPVYATNSAEEARYVLDHSESIACFAGTGEHLAKVQSIRKSLPKLKTVIVFDELPDQRDGALPIHEAYRKGDEYGNTGEFDVRLRGVGRDDLATIVYTSGTTGDPKGVMLSHGNILANIRQSIKDYLPILTVDEVYLSMLPLSHVLERTLGYYLPISYGAKVAFAENIQTVAQNLGEIRPTIFYSVPRLFEKIHAGIVSLLSAAPPKKQKIFNLAMETARKNLPYVCVGKKPGPLLGIKVKIMEKLVYSKLKALLGMDRLKLCLSGGGPLSVSDAEFFIGMGILIYEGYGLTETSPLLSANYPGNIMPGSVGQGIEDTIIRLSDEGEIQVKGPQVMPGYYKDDEATAMVFTEDGFFKTGDIGRMDEEGRLYITGRIKDIIVTSGGKNISPQNIENCLRESPYIEYASIIGDNRKYLSALIVPAFEELKKWALLNGVRYNDITGLANNERVRGMYEEEIQLRMKNFSRVEQIRAFKLLAAEWSQETGELTPTLKVKRRIIESKYADEIEQLYREN